MSRSKVIDENIKLVITNSKNKEGININSEVDLLVVENHYYTDIKQICGRFRLGVPVALIVATPAEVIVIFQLPLALIVD